MIEVRNLRKVFHVHKKAPGFAASVRSLFVRRKIAKVAVEDLSFDVGEGEIVGLIGANGAGKTTVVKMLAGIIHPTAGDARVLGHQPWRREDALRRQIALIMGQKAQLWWDLPAGDCFLLLREIYRIDQADFQRRLDELANMLEVTDLLDIQIRRLSLGERMKMELIAALLHGPRVVYLDEPTIGLDLSAQRALREFILQYRREHRPAMIVTSHYMEDIEQLCRRLLILRAGELVWDGSLEEVVSRFARYKVLTAELRRQELPPARQEGLDAIGRVIEHEASRIRLDVPRAQVTEAASFVLAHYPVADLTIEEEPVGRIIERIQRHKEAAS